jgi:hypothetical protein
MATPKTILKWNKLMVKVDPIFIEAYTINNFSVNKINLVLKYH